MTVDDFERQLENLGQGLIAIDQVLLATGGRFVADMKNYVPVDTGELRNSLKAIVENNTLKINMKLYGAFQNYGVAGTEVDSRYGVVDEVQNGVTPMPLMSSKYQYKTKRYGIPATRFFDASEMSDYLVEAVEEYLINQLEE